MTALVLIKTNCPLNSSIYLPLPQRNSYSAGRSTGWSCSFHPLPTTSEQRRASRRRPIKESTTSVGSWETVESDDKDDRRLVGVFVLPNARWLENNNS